MGSFRGPFLGQLWRAYHAYLTGVSESSISAGRTFFQLFKIWRKWAISLTKEKTSNLSTTKIQRSFKVEKYNKQKIKRSCRLSWQLAIQTERDSEIWKDFRKRLYLNWRKNNDRKNRRKRKLFFISQLIENKFRWTWKKARKCFPSAAESAAAKFTWSKLTA